MTSRLGELRDTLGDHLAVDEQEQKALAEILDLISSSSDPFAPDYYEPGHVTASGFVVHPRSGMVALVHHLKLGRWLQPGGHVEDGDRTVVAAAAREVQEETGLKDLAPIGLLDLDVHTFPARGDTPSHLHFDVRWAFAAAEAVLVAGDGISRAAWFAFDEVVSWGDRSLARPVSKLAGNLRGR